ncbi:formylglycine-generating enzyme family protein [Treponema sp. OMZ 799]|uniref:formylglycine-generating enzyme family protein n=1 Tax=unclassified Treponema TaxID=2638727 RepID=UPI0020A54712|nr:MULTISPECIES: SUMF1/EgtB/PvdO family nonheme iron enzyme [unclassified Treponema]UTC62099.1 SUMF1/EgtB/PvdO family nonheme iron enzyme [Treponema sp. OMZ 787]UTC78698.1 formylglycine-generating enzyme family protein [Treponema sp. OMZ 799]
MIKLNLNKSSAASSGRLCALKRAAALIIAAILAMVLTACPQSGGGGGTPPTPPAVGSFEDTGDGFVKITPPAKGILGVDPDYTLPGSQDYWKGVFIKDRKVKLSPYKLGKTEVTYKLWKEVYDEAVKPEHGYVFANEGRKGSDGTGNDEEQPVTNISWRDCIVWCNAYTQIKLGSDEQCVYRESNASGAAVLKDATKKVEGSSTEFICDKAYADMKKKGFRLPTEAEWEYAARWQGSNTENAAQYGDVWLTKLNSASGAKKPIGFSGLALPAGETWETLRDELTRVAVYDEWWNGTDWVDQTPATTKTAAVKSKDPNALGLYDMSGNVWEWCFDWYGSIGAGEVIDPQGAASGADRVRRGGGWSYYAYYCAVGERNGISPGDGFISLGFRLAWCP